MGRYVNNSANQFRFEFLRRLLVDAMELRRVIRSPVCNSGYSIGRVLRVAIRDIPMLLVRCLSSLYYLLSFTSTTIAKPLTNPLVNA